MYGSQIMNQQIMKLYYIACRELSDDNSNNGSSATSQQQQQQPPPPPASATSDESLEEMALAAAMMEVEEEEKEKEKKSTENVEDEDDTMGENSSPFTADLTGSPSPAQLMREWRGQVSEDTKKIEALANTNSNSSLSKAYFAFHP